MVGHNRGGNPGVACGYRKAVRRHGNPGAALQWAGWERWVQYDFSRAATDLCAPGVSAGAATVYYRP